jgi:hypothetical protein
MSVTTYYISRVISVPPFVACAAYDDLLSDPSTLVIASDDNELRLDARSLRGNRTTRGKLGHIRTPGGRMTCLLEIEPWSARKTQLGLRPQRWGPRAWPNHRQLGGGHALLGALAAQIEDWSEAPLRDWADAWLRSAVRNVTE